jgi:serine phosphatase RsbU (regulator of sigma subunit)
MLTAGARLAGRFASVVPHRNRFALSSIRFSLQKVWHRYCKLRLHVVLGNWTQGGTMRAAATKQQLDRSTQNHLDSVLEKELDQLQQRVSETARGEFFFYVTDSARELLLLSATEQHYDEQRLKLAIERHIVYPLANLFATDRINAGDMIRIDRDRNQPRLNFIREVEDDLAPPLRHLEAEAIAGLFLRTLGSV